MAYRIEFLNRARRELESVAPADRVKILKKIKALADNPRPRQVKKLSGDLEGHYRIRVGNYRIVYCIKDEILIVVVVRIGHRKEIYR